MRGFNRSTPFVLLATALAGVTCAFPTDKSDKVFVTLTSPGLVVLRGQDMSVYAQAWHVVGTDTQAIGNVDFQFYTGSSSIARVQNDGAGYATVTGVNSGNVDITARAVAFENAGQANLVLRVSNPLEIDSVRPATVHYGELLTVYGVGVDSMFIATLSDVTLIEYPFSRVRDPATGLGQITFWVPPPAQSDNLFYLGAGVFGVDTATTNVLKGDVFEPNDTIPSQINLDLAGPWPGTPLAPIAFTNPALAFEPIDRNATSGEDWFRFSISDTTQPLTFFITYPSFGDTSAAATRTFLLDSLLYATGVPGDPIEKFFGRDSADFISSDFFRCKGDFFGPTQESRESTTVALRTLPSHALHVMTFFEHPQRYGLTVAKGYFTADSRVGMDKYEENDLCHYADSIPGRPSPSSRLHIPTRASGQQFNDTMTVDNPFEIDWYRLEVPAGALGDSLLIRTQARPFVLGRDSSDVDIYLMTVPGVSDTIPGTFVMDVLAEGLNLGSTEALLVGLPAGSYYLAVVDFAGVPTRYSMCVRMVPATGIRNCGPLAGAPSFSAPRMRPKPSRSGLLESDKRPSFLGSPRH